MVRLPYLKPFREPSKETAGFRNKSRSGTIHSNLLKAAENAKLAQQMGRKKISPEALEKFEMELEKLAEKHGVRRTSSERTMTLPAKDSRGDLKLPVEAVNGTPEANEEVIGDATKSSMRTSIASDKSFSMS